MPRDPSWDSTYKSFTSNPRYGDRGKSAYYAWLNKNKFNDTKPRRKEEQRLRNIGWVGDVSAVIDQPYKVLMHLRPACSLNRLCYSDQEMMMAARSLATKPIFTNHSPTLANGKMKSEGMWVHSDWVPEQMEVQAVGFVYDKHLWEEIKLHGRAPVSQRTHYFKSYKEGGFEYPVGIVFDEASLIVDDADPGKPGDYVEALEAWHANMSYAVEAYGFEPSAPNIGEKKMEKGREQATPPLAKLSPLVPQRMGRFGGPKPPKYGIRDVTGGEVLQPQAAMHQTRYGQGYREKPAPATIDLPAKYGPPLNYARIRGGPGVDIPFRPSFVQMPTRGGQPQAEPTAKPHMNEQDSEDGELAATGLPKSARGPGVIDAGAPKAPTSPAQRGPAPKPSYRTPASPSGNEAVSGDPRTQRGVRPLQTGTITGGPAVRPPAPKPSYNQPGAPSGNEQDGDGEDGEDDEDGDGEDDGDGDVKRRMPGQDSDGEDGDGEAGESVWTTRYINALPNSAFALPKERKYPHHNKAGQIDAAHVIACGSYAAKTGNESALAHCDNHKKELKIGAYATSAKERLQWDRFERDIAPLFALEMQAYEADQAREALEARLAGTVEEALNKEFAKSKLGEFTRTFGTGVANIYRRLEALEECAAEQNHGNTGDTGSVSNIDANAVAERVLSALNRRAQQVANQSMRESRLPPLVGRNIAVEYARKNTRNSLRQLGFQV